MAIVTLTGSLLVPASDLAAVRAALPRHVELTLAEPGCLTFRVEEDPGESGRFRVYEQFCDAAAFRKHQERVRASDWGAVSANAERDYRVEGL